MELPQLSIYDWESLVVNGSSVRVEFANGNDLFYPRENLDANVIISLGGAIRCKKMELNLKGNSHVSWESYVNDQYTTHRGHEVLLDTTTILMAPQTPGEEIIIPRGEMSYPFEFRLPSNLLPSTSRDLLWGGVFYFIEVKIIRDADNSPAWVRNHRKRKYIRDLTASIPFKVVSPPINPTPFLIEPAVNSVEKYICCLCCRSGPVRLHCTLPKKLYNLGEKIVFSVEVDNTETNDDQLGAVTAQLLANYTLYSDHSEKTARFNVVSSLCLTENVQERSVGKWTDVSLEIPSDATPTFKNCKRIHLEYVFTVWVEIGSWAFDPKITVPVEISSGPLTIQPTSLSSPAPASENVIQATALGSIETGASTQANMPGAMPTSHPFPNGYHVSTSNPKLTGYPGHAERTSYPLTTITQQPTGDIPGEYSYIVFCLTE